LIANWGTVTTHLATATPAITSPATGTVSITHGTNQAFTITVSGPGGTPTGDVSLIAEPPGFAQVGVGFATLANGTATITTNMLPGDDTTGAGTPYPIIAHYAGDGTFGPADSQPINVTVNRENSTTTETLYNEDIPTGDLTATTSVQYGTNYVMIVNVVGATAGVICNNNSAFNPSVPSTITEIPTIPCPTGTITLTDNSQPLKDFVQTGASRTNTSTVSNLGFVEDLLIQLSGGPNPIVASYSGDNSYSPSASTNGAFTVTPGPTQTAVTLNGGLTPTSAAAGQSVTLVATVTTGYTQSCSTGTCQSVSNGAGPTGTVTFSSCGTAASCTVPVVPVAFSSTSGAGATATLTTSFNTAPAQPITAAFTTGDLNYSSCATSGTPAGCSLTSLTLTITGTVGTASKLVFTAEPSNVPAGVAIAPAVQVAVQDASGNIISGATNPVTIAIGANPGGGTLGGTLTATPVNGIATFSNSTISVAGTGYTLTASATGLTGATSTGFNVTTSPVKLAFTTQPSNTNTGAFIIPAVAVIIQDVNGVVVTGATNPVTIAIGANPGTGTLGGTATANPVNGTATFPNLSISAAGTGYTLTASATGLTGATSAAFNVLATPSKLAFIAQPSNSVADKSISPAVQVAVQDVNGNVIAGATTPITIAIGTDPGTGTLAGTVTAAPALGIATFSNLNINTAGTGYTLTASAANLTGATSTTFNVTAPVSPSFTVSYPPQPTVLNSSTGTASGTLITITSSNGFNSPVTINLPAILPPGVSCTAPAAITPPANGIATGTLNCQVVATSTATSASILRDQTLLDAKVIPPAAGSTDKAWWTLSAGTGFAALFLIFLPGGRKKYRAAIGLGLVCLLALTMGCNGGGGTTPPPPGLTATVTKMTVTSPTNKLPSGTAFTFSVSVTGGTPTGQVELFDGATMIGTAAAVSGGTASLTAPTSLAVGTHSISVHYLGDTTTAASQSGALNLTVAGGPTTIAITTTPAATPPAGAINITIQ